MSADRQSQPSLSCIARAAHAQALREGMSGVTFAQRLADAYHAGTGVHERVIEFKVGTTADSQIAAMKNNAKIVERLCNGTIRFPFDLVEAWAAALPDAVGLTFRRDVARRLGFLGVLPPQAHAPGADVGVLAAEFGQTMQALAPLLVNGTIDASDCHVKLRRALREGADLMAAWLTVQQQIVRALGGDE